MMTVLFTCRECGSGVHVYPDQNCNKIKCEICETESIVSFDESMEESMLKSCPSCHGKDFYKQKDFNRIVGVVFFLIPTAICLFVGLLEGIFSYIGFWILDYLLFGRLRTIAICYHCDTIFRGVSNLNEVSDFNHKLRDEIAFSQKN